jgi:hypothetical protein
VICVAAKAFTVTALVTVGVAIAVVWGWNIAERVRG